MLDKAYIPGNVEERLYKEWEVAGAFSCGSNSARERYSIVIPPPNVTGSLHMGHALNNTLQDIIIRVQRMRGKDVLWQPGNDHAGIATQMVVERMLSEEKSSRQLLGRENFINRVWQWKEESGGLINKQLRRLGASCDWSRERFTMDEGLSNSVLTAFVKLYEQGLIYKDQRLVNWDPKLQTAISDLEVQQQEVSGHIWHLRYPMDDDPNQHIVVATTRPETMLGDTAVAVHPSDDRYTHLVGKYVVLPISNRNIPIIADEYADPEQGSGAVKITPAHDFNDFDVGRRHRLEMITVMDEAGRMNENTPSTYQGLDRYEARKRIIEDLDSLGLVETIEQYLHMVPFGDRGGVPIEPRLTEQWFVDAKTLAKPALEAVRRGKTKIVPAAWEKTYYEWMENIQPWCISRQLWWGHQIPAWYGPDQQIFVAMSEKEALDLASKQYGRRVNLTRDEDVLDTWFSSALWPFSTLGWPDTDDDAMLYYPTSLLVTGFDILFFWVARMMMMGIRFMGNVPFHTVYIHALVRDEKGQKMSKSKGNIIDPLELIENFGADALRFTLASQAAQGRDVKLSQQRVAGNRNFATKIWNAARFCELNHCEYISTFDPRTIEDPTNRWIVGALSEVAYTVTLKLDQYKFNEAANEIYHFVWGDFCDWYLELIKPVLQDAEGPIKKETQETSAWVFDGILRLLHPFMPFVTEELWQKLCPNKTTFLMLSDWPELSGELIDVQAKDGMEWVIRLVTVIRSVRAEMNVPASAKVKLYVRGANIVTTKRIEAHLHQILVLARISSFQHLHESVPVGSVQTIVDEATFIMPLSDVIDINEEQNRLERELQKVKKTISGFEKRLENEHFTSKAPDHVVEENRVRLADAKIKEGRLVTAINSIRSV